MPLVLYRQRWQGQMESLVRGHHFSRVCLLLDAHSRNLRDKFQKRTWIIYLKTAGHFLALELRAFDENRPSIVAIKFGCNLAQGTSLKDEAAL